MTKIYKYFSHEILDLVFEREDYCGLKFSRPQDYNDPYELFLALDLSVPTEHLATYNDVVQKLPQFPTTCFSKSPIVSPMWAHYADNHSGFVLEFDTEVIAEHYPENPARDVIYRDGPNEELNDLLAKASVVGKPRHASWLRDAVFVEAYFSKYRDWAYEQECRMIVGTEDTEDMAGNTILFLPVNCISAIIVGSKFPESKNPTAKRIADRYEFDTYRVEIGRSYPVPYFENDAGTTFTFEDGEVTEADFICESCSEPLIEEGENCPWCRITEGHMHNAAMMNPFRMLEKYGRLDSYLEEVNRIKRRTRS